MDAISPFGYLSFISTIIICLTFSIVYILALYIFSPSSYRYDRDHPHVISRRFLAVVIVCSLVYLSLKYTCNPNININTWLGFRTNIPSLWQLCFYPIALTLMLYFGPILQWIDLFDWNYYRVNWKHHVLLQNTSELLIFLRNYVVAPFTEEFVFRSSILCLLYSHVSFASAVFLSPLFFGLAHLHHMLEHFKRNHEESQYRLMAMQIIGIHLFQFSYTYIFGVYASFLLIRTGHFVPSFVVHALCNMLGMPDFMNLMDTSDEQRVRKYIIIILYIIGLYLFSTFLFSLTQSKFYYTNDSSMIVYGRWSN